MKTAELMTFLEQKFDAIDVRFSRLETYLEQRFDEAAATYATSLELTEVQSDIRRLDQRIDGVYEHIDGLSGRIDTYHQEFLMLSAQVERMQA